MQQITTARSIMLEFAAATGLTGASREPRRYLWTDAFAVCNYLELYRQSGEQQFMQLAEQLVDQVHHTLGKHHRDSGHHGWLSGLDEAQARQHPTIGGLRIGKRLNERQPDEAFDDYLEWERDGQYFHYLTKWMHALDRLSQVTGKSMYNQWARELAKKAHAGFTYTSAGGSKRMYWKMSVDLTRPQVASMGHHDPLDGLITCLQLEASAKNFPGSPEELSLRTEIEELTTMCTGRSWATDDALGIGGLLSDAHTLIRLIAAEHLQETARADAMLHDIELSLQTFSANNQLHLPAEYRLAFRELGLSIGLHAISRMQQIIEQRPEIFAGTNQISSTLNHLSRYQDLTEIIEGFWLEAEHRAVNSWLEHADINNVMLATSLTPDGYL